MVLPYCHLTSADKIKTFHNSQSRWRYNLDLILTFIGRIGIYDC